jgi:hypothetical protein
VGRGQLTVSKGSKAVAIADRPDKAVNSTMAALPERRAFSLLITFRLPFSLTSFLAAGVAVDWRAGCSLRLWN